MSNTIVLTGKDLTALQIAAIVANKNQKITIAPKAIAGVEAAFAFLQKNVNKKIIYGVNTGFGPMASHIMSQDHVVELQYNLIRSHAVGMGEPIDPEIVLAAMVVRLNMLVRGTSGVSVKLLQTLQKFINARVIPVVPEHGAVGTSGDLVQLAHIALALIGEGQVWYDGKIQAAASVLKKLNIKPHALHPKEGLSLINGTAVMAGGAALLVRDAHRLVDLAVLHGATALEVVASFDDSFSEVLNGLRPHSGQVAVAARLRDILSSSRRIRSRENLAYDNAKSGMVKQIEDRVQEVYSLRCIPQIVGPVLDTLERFTTIVEVEMNATTDNPIIDIKNERFLHGGNFHGDYVATAVDQLKAALVKLSILSERRVNFFLNKNVNKIYSPFLNLHTPGLTLGLQGLQFVATSTAADNQSLAFPHSVHSISTNADNQDVVSMGTDAMLFARKVVDNSFIITAIEAVVLAQAVDVTAITKELAAPTKQWYKAVRKQIGVITGDRVLINELQRITAFIKQ